MQLPKVYIWVLPLSSSSQNSVQFQTWIFIDIDIRWFSLFSYCKIVPLWMRLKFKYEIVLVDFTMDILQPTSHLQSIINFSLNGFCSSKWFLAVPFYISEMRSISFKVLHVVFCPLAHLIEDQSPNTLISIIINMHSS